jgi:hypothetical protein
LFPQLRETLEPFAVFVCESHGDGGRQDLEEKTFFYFALWRFNGFFFPFILHIHIHFCCIPHPPPSGISLLHLDQTMDRIMETCRLPAQQPSTTTSSNDDGDGLKAFLPPGFPSMEEYLVCLKAFLSGCEPVTDLMIVDYFTTNSWETRMPQSWREAFECPQGKLSSLDLMRLVSLGHLRDFKEPAAGTTATASSTMASEEGGIQDWPESLKDFVRMVKALSINRTLDPDCKSILEGSGLSSI